MLYTDREIKTHPMGKSKRRLTAKATAVEASYESRSLAKGLKLLEALAPTTTSMPLKDLAELVGLGKPSTLRLLRTLVATGYLKRDQNESYTLTHDWPDLSQRHALSMVREAGIPVLHAMNAEFGETVSLAFVFDDLIRVIEVVESTHQIRMSNYKGGVLQPYASSLGKAITAFQTPERLQRLLYTYGFFRLTPATLPDIRAVQEDLALVRERGYAWDREETVPGGTCIGAPIRSPDEKVISALSISMPKDRFSTELEDLLPVRIKDYADQVAHAMRSFVDRANHAPAKTMRPVAAKA
jgi:IclR family acetate operon transcriptional repressor